MQINQKWLEDREMCNEGMDWWKSKKFKEIKGSDLYEILIKNDHYIWARWLLLRCISIADCIRYGCYAAELVLPIFEKKYPKDKCPRKAITAIKKYLKNPTQKNKQLVGDAATAVGGTCVIVYAAAYATCAGATCSAYVYAVVYEAAGVYDVYAAYDADVRSALRKKLIAYGFKLIKGGLNENYKMDK